MKINIFLTILILILGISSCSASPSKFSEGDVIFIESQSSQSPYIKLVQGSKWTHCGIIVKTPNGLQVLEASKTVRLTPIDTFISRSKSGYTVMYPEDHISNINYQKYLGIPYDLEFKFNNGKFYCSELVYEIYKEHGIKLQNPRKVSSYWFTRIPKVKQIMKNRNIQMDQEVISPVDILTAYSLW